ncbi:GAF domain-containing protein [Alteromonas sp. CYL-A6]|uniref:GAF domain-containing protein n=1 Tax=Alteromonas nitratireducens TaxID=3390813 RepID=UPI0034C008B4
MIAEDDATRYWAPLHDLEYARVDALHATGLLDTPPSPRLDMITKSVAEVFDVPLVLLSLVDFDRQWFLSKHGSELTETNRDVSFCAHAILEDEILVIEDTRRHPVYMHNPLVTFGMKVGFYAGAVIRNREGLPLGALCIVSPTARRFTVEDEKKLIYYSKLAREEMFSYSRLQKQRGRPSASTTA